MDKEVIIRFRKFIKTDLVSGCLVWNGATSRGYGSFTYKGKSWGAHRFAWRLHHGDIPEGMKVLHECDNPPCVNMDHLFLGTDADNSRDKVSKGRNRSPVGEAHPQAKITERDVIRIRALGESGAMTLKQICKEFGITCSHVRRVLNRQSWRHV